MNKRYVLNFTLTILVSFFILTGCTLAYRLDEQKKNELINNQKQIEGTEVSKPENNPAVPKITTLKEQLAVQSQVKKFKDYEELKEFLEENDLAPASYGNGIYTERMFGVSPTMENIKMAPGIGLGTGVADMGLAMPVEKNMSASEAGANRATNDYSKTNVQVEGVDEADIIKSDGTYIYAVSRNNLFIIKAYPAETAEILSKIEFKSRPSDIYINGDKLVVFGSDDLIYKAEFYQKFRRRNPFTFFKVFDVADKKNPKQVRDLDFEGSYNNSRMIGDYVYFVTANYNYYFLDEEPILPRILDNGQELPNVCDTKTGLKCFMPPVYYFNIPYDSYNFTTITAINIKDEQTAPTGEVYVMSGNQNMYVSPDNIYITYTKYLSEYQLEMEVMRELIYPKLSKKDQERIDKIESAENFILAPSEKNEKISQIIARYGETLTDVEQINIENELKNKMKEKYENIAEELEKTVIHKIAIDQGVLSYKNFGEVTGVVLNQFSMDESGGYFRIATTKNQTWSRFADAQQKSYSNLFVLDGDMKTVGSLKGLAEGERIYSVRFMQNRAYLVTFEQVDPLFVIDLADPKNPTVLGKLKIPGFSNYLHPYDETTLIGIGKDTKENQWGGVQTLGIKLSLFDVSNVAEPKEINSYVLGGAGSDSAALTDHRAFLFSKEKNLLVIPVSINESKGIGIWGGLEFSGAAVFQINKDGFKLRGKIDHSDNGKISPVDYWGGYNYYDNTVKRSLYIEDVLCTFSNNYLKMNKLQDLSVLKNLQLVKESTDGSDDINIIN